MNDSSRTLLIESQSTSQSVLDNSCITNCKLMWQQRKVSAIVSLFFFKCRRWHEISIKCISLYDSKWLRSSKLSMWPKYCHNLDYGLDLRFCIIVTSEKDLAKWPAPLCTTLLYIIVFDNMMLEEVSDISSPVPLHQKWSPGVLGNLHKSLCSPASFSLRWRWSKNFCQISSNCLDTVLPLFDDT